MSPSIRPVPEDFEGPTLQHIEPLRYVCTISELQSTLSVQAENATKIETTSHLETSAGHVCPLEFVLLLKIKVYILISKLDLD